MRSLSIIYIHVLEGKDVGDLALCLAFSLDYARTTHTLRERYMLLFSEYDPAILTRVR